MSDANGNKGLLETSVGMFGKLAGTLPPVFIMLLFVNLIFLALVMWFLSHQMDEKLAVLNKIIDHCFAIKHD